jgi:hypothetical protein
VGSSIPSLQRQTGLGLLIKNTAVAAMRTNIATQRSCFVTFMVET